MKLSYFATILLAAGVFCGVCSAYPEPAAVPAAHHWNVDVEFSKPYQISVQLPGDTKPKRFWYIVLTVTNNELKDVPFYPSCELMTDTLKIIPAGKNVMSVVFDRIKVVQQGRYPYLEPLENVDHTLLQGADNSRDIAVIWPDFDKKAKHVDLFIGGMSNEVAAIDHPFKKDAAGNPVKVLLRKTLQLSYSFGGDNRFRSQTKMIYKGRNWVMR